MDWDSCFALTMSVIETRPPGFSGGNPDRAVEWYGRFVDLWSEADPELQPVVRDVQARIQRLTSEGRR
jgi:hypothetical protein